MTGTFVLALLGVILSVASILWQVFSFLLTGPRPQVTVQLGLADDDGVPRASWNVSSSPSIDDDPAMRDLTREIVMIEVTNRGRSAFTLLTTGIAAGSWTLLSGRNAAIVSTGREERVRLEPGDIHRWHADVWPLVERLRELRDEPTLKVRGCVRLGGGAAAFSGRSSLWTVPVDLRSVVASRGFMSRTGPRTSPWWTRLTRWTGKSVTWVTESSAADDTHRSSGELDSTMECSDVTSKPDDMAAG